MSSRKHSLEVVLSCLATGLLAACAQNLNNIYPREKELAGHEIIERSVELRPKAVSRRGVEYLFKPDCSQQNSSMFKPAKDCSCSVSDQQKELYDQQVNWAINWSKKHKDYALIVIKGDYEVRVYKDGINEVTYPIQLGFNPCGTKERQGDGRTPEGRYTITGRYLSQFDLFLAFNYPNLVDLSRFRDMKQQGLLPKYATIGGALGLHGSEFSGKGGETRNWTLGCVGTANDNIRMIGRKVKVGKTPLVIVGQTSVQ